MKQFLALFIARNKEFYRDHATLGWTFIFPLIVIAGFAYGYKGDSQTLFKVGVFSQKENTALIAFQHQTLQNLKSLESIQWVPIENLEAGIKKVRMHQLDFLISESENIKYWMNPDSSKGKLVEHLLIQGNKNAETLDKQAVLGREIRYVEWLIPGILAMNMMFSSLFGVGYTIVRYRKNGVLKRLRATPVTAFQFLAAQLVSRLLLILMTSSLVFLGTKSLVGLTMQGSYLDLLIYHSMGASCMISLGLVFASRISSEEVAEGLLNLLTWPMMFLSGIWFSLDGASPIVQAIAKVFPLTHVVLGARSIILEGAKLSSLLPKLEILGIMGLLFLILGSIFFKWE